MLFFALLALLFLSVALLILAAIIFWPWMLIHCLTNQRLTETQRAIWAIIIIITGLVGAAIYFFFGRETQVVQYTVHSTYRDDQRQTIPKTPAPYQVSYQPQDTPRSYQAGYQPRDIPHPYRGQQAVPDVSTGEEVSTRLQAEYEQIQISYPEEP